MSASSDSSRRVSVTADLYRRTADEGGSDGWMAAAQLRARPSNRLSLSARVAAQRSTDDLQYAETVPTDAGSRYVLGRVGLDTWEVTFRADLAITPELTVQYYGSPFLGTGRYSAFKRATDTLAGAYESRFHRYQPDELAVLPSGERYLVTEGGGGPSYSFANPDFSFRQFRSNLVARWEYRPGSSLYLVWSQGRTNEVPSWEGSFGRNWSELWATPPDNVFLVKLSYWFSP